MDRIRMSQDTQPHLPRPAPEGAREDVESLKTLLRSRGLSVTAARVGVLQLLREGHAHRSAAEIRDEVLERYPAIDSATVYRTLETLEENGLAVRVVTGEKLVQWAHMTNAHHHMVCRRCGRIFELDHAPISRLAEDISTAYGHHVDTRHIVLHGLCVECASPGSEAGSA
jgi:Fe2+ or Zn2+ uptake regulation protein